MKKLGCLAAIAVLAWPLVGLCNPPTVTDDDGKPVEKIAVDPLEGFAFRIEPAKNKRAVVFGLDSKTFFVFQSDGSRVVAQPRKGVAGTFAIQIWHAGDAIKLPDKGPLPDLPVATVSIVVGKSSPPPKKPDDPKDPPAKGLYFMLVRPDGPADPAFTRVARDPAWAKLTVAGHLVKDFGLSDLNRLGVVLPSGTSLPCVVTLQDDGTQSRIVRGPVALPSDSQAILDLPKGVSP